MLKIQSRTAGIQRRRHLSSKVFYRYKSASREIVYHRKSVSKLILLLSPIKCHFTLQCFSSSVILKRISIGKATIATVKTTATVTAPSLNCHNVLCIDRNGRNHSQLLCVCVVVLFCILLCMFCCLRMNM